MITHLAFTFFHINLVSKHNEREILWIMRTCLNKKLITPAIKSFKRFGAVDVIYQNTTIRAPIEGDTK
jgi:hypothetical protein